MGSSMEKAACRVNNPFQNEGYYSDWNFDAALRLDVGQVAYSLNDGEHRAIAAGFIQWCLGVSAKCLYREVELESVSWVSCWHIISQSQVHVNCAPLAVLCLGFGQKSWLSSDGFHSFSWLHQGLQLPIMTLTLTVGDCAVGSGSH